MERPSVLSGLKKIIVLRALFLGDMLCSVPALRALRHAAPTAQIVLAGLPWAREFAQRFNRYIDAFIEFPGFPGLPEQPCRDGRYVKFLQEVQAMGFDLAIQLHGSGAQTNVICAQMHAKETAGYYPRVHTSPNEKRFLPYPQNISEVERNLNLVRFLGGTGSDPTLEFPIFATDERRLDAVDQRLARADISIVCVHSGGKLATRRWLVDRFANVANALARQGHFVVLTGTTPEETLVAQLSGSICFPHLNVCGQTDLGMCAALIRRARLVVSNDTGISHLAAAVGTPSVVVFLGSDAGRWAPRDVTRHRIVSADVPCRPCEFMECPIGFPCAHQVTTESVLNAAQELLAPQFTSGAVQADCPSASLSMSAMRKRCISLVV
jgi:ADP-heptose:LPS heptosyltransferase